MATECLQSDTPDCSLRLYVYILCLFAYKGVAALAPPRRAIDGAVTALRLAAAAAAGPCPGLRSDDGAAAEKGVRTLAAAAERPVGAGHVIDDLDRTVP